MTAPMALPRGATIATIILGLVSLISFFGRIVIHSDVSTEISEPENHRFSWLTWDGENVAALQEWYLSGRGGFLLYLVIHALLSWIVSCVSLVFLGSWLSSTTKELEQWSATVARAHAGADFPHTLSPRRWRQMVTLSAVWFLFTFTMLGVGDQTSFRGFEPAVFRSHWRWTPDGEVDFEEDVTLKLSCGHDQFPATLYVAGNSTADPKWDGCSSAYDAEDSVSAHLCCLARGSITREWDGVDATRMWAVGSYFAFDFFMMILFGVFGLLIASFGRREFRRLKQEYADRASAQAPIDHIDRHDSSPSMSPLESPEVTLADPSRVQMSPPPLAMTPGFNRFTDLDDDGDRVTEMVPLSPMATAVRSPSTRSQHTGYDQV